METEKNFLDKEVKLPNIDFSNIFNFNVKTFVGRIRFLLTFVCLGLLTVIFGDVLFHLSLKGAGVITIVIGCICLLAGFIVPGVLYMNEIDNGRY